ncbi:PTS sugar transporter subunit IIB [Chryseolinea lacunae]|uniref:PTS sugar transporter subunit IIB n=1 Tax=Chryseolinea lacunae TaxID=2801331 RepID=A0ABS1KK59_9BACT|nr:PTS sugar transporter subunit IIB [Chryseolinea lacunae]MBL0739844.1 PTS sugar transporter subunit IIB [Chryseolinea lacunae]
MIKLIRIDDRLVHGQVAFTWVPSLGVDCLIVANDKIVKDDFQKMTLGLAKPAGVKQLIKSIADTVVFLNDDKNAALKILVLVNTVKDAFALASGVQEIRAINFGGLRAREGAKQISKAVALTDEDIVIIKELVRRDIELEIRQVPSDEKQKMSSMIQV